VEGEEEFAFGEANINCTRTRSPGKVDNQGEKILALRNFKRKGVRISEFGLLCDKKKRGDLRSQIRRFKPGSARGPERKGECTFVCHCQKGRKKEQRIGVFYAVPYVKGDARR